MKNKFPEIAILLITIILFTFGCWKSQSQLTKSEANHQQVKNISANEISQLENGVTVQFPAILKQGAETNCIEIFNEDEFKKYNGDLKWAVLSRFASDSRSTSFEEGKKVLITGKMTLVKGVSDTSKTCGIVTGQLFEITEINNF